MELQGATICSKLNQLQRSSVEGSTSELNCSYRNTVSKELVHRAAVSEVFLTDVEMIDENKFITGAHLPKTHAYYNDIPSTNGKLFYDNILLLEICRQSSIIITHNHYKIPLTAKFIFNEAKFRILDNDLLLVSATPSSVLTEVDVISKDMRNGKLSGLTFEMRLYINGQLSAKKLMDISWLDAIVWKKIRRKPLKNAQETALKLNKPYKNRKLEYKSLVGRGNDSNVVIYSTEECDGKSRAQLLINELHPAIFDHPLDHVPGMLLIESFRQMAFLCLYKKFDIYHENVFMKTFDIDFIKFTELGLDTYCYIDNICRDECTGNVRMVLSIRQNNLITALCNIEFSNKKEHNDEK